MKMHTGAASLQGFPALNYRFAAYPGTMRFFKRKKQCPDRLARKMNWFLMWSRAS